jgi:hypothetical protein
MHVIHDSKSATLFPSLPFFKNAMTAHIFGLNSNDN